MRDATGLHKIGVSECAQSRRMLADPRLPRERRPLKLVRAVEVRRGTAYKIERRVHDALDAYRVDFGLRKEREWFRASMRRCNAALDAALED